MSGYIPIGREERRRMLAEMGLSPEELFSHIPEDIRFKREGLEALSAAGLSELELTSFFKELAALNRGVEDYDSYLGAGFYDHLIPAAIQALIQRQEFLTSYTPYQQEISQGTLQATFEWQSYICRLTGMDVANSSMYDGASAAAEAALMAFRVKTKAEKVWLSGGLNPQTVETICSYLKAAGLSYELGQLNEDGGSLGTWPQEGGYAAFIVQSPNYYGIPEDLEALAAAAHAADALAIASCDPVSLAIFKTPGSCGMDIVVGEAQPLGAALNYGGPALGYMCSTEKLVRKMPGRICGETIDRDGKTAYVLTLQAREQHIRRERATSNICTSQALLATAASIYLSLMGRRGLAEAAWQSADKARYLHDRLLESGCFRERYHAPFFREFALRAEGGLELEDLNRRLLDEKIFGGLVLPGNVWLLAVTEKKSQKAIDRFVTSVVRLAAEQKEGRK